MPTADKTQQIRKLHQTMYEQSLLFLALMTSPDGETKRAETRELIIQLYSKIQDLL